MAKWRLVSEEAPKEFVTVLTLHEDDLYPVAAFRCPPSDVEGEQWLRELEGPEDTFDGRPGKCESLYRAPTHWMPLEELPELAVSRSRQARRG